MNKRIEAELVSQYINGLISGPDHRKELPSLFHNVAGVDSLLRMIDRLTVTYQLVQPSPIFQAQLQAGLLNRPPDMQMIPTFSWQRLLWPAAASVLSAAAIVLLIGRMRASAGAINQPVRAASAG